MTDVEESGVRKEIFAASVGGGGRGVNICNLACRIGRRLRSGTDLGQGGVRGEGECCGWGSLEGLRFDRGRGKGLGGGRDGG